MGLSGTDGGLLRVRPHRPQGRDLGFVGEVERVDPAPLRLLLDNGYVPVLSSTAADPLGEAYNINADLVAGSVAGALGAARLLFLSDVAGVMVEGERVPVLEASRVRALLAGSEIQGGMRPKLEGALAALAAGVPRVHLIDGRVRHALPIEIFYDQGGGTLVVPDARSSEPPPWTGTLADRGAATLITSYARYPIELGGLCLDDTE